MKYSEQHRRCGNQGCFSEPDVLILDKKIKKIFLIRMVKRIFKQNKPGELRLKLMKAHFS